MWCHCVFLVRQDWNLCAIVSSRENKHTTTKRRGVHVETCYDVTKWDNSLTHYLTSTLLENTCFKGELHPWLKISMFCALSHNCQHLLKNNMYLIVNCDVIKQNQLEVGNIDFKIEPNKAENVFCFLLFLASFNCSYLWNQLTNFNVVFCKM